MVINDELDIYIPFLLFRPSVLNFGLGLTEELTGRLVLILCIGMLVLIDDIGLLVLIDDIGLYGGRLEIFIF